MILRALILWLALSGQAHAQEFLNRDTALSDDDFYRLVACAAPVNGECGKPFVRWP